MSALVATKCGTCGGTVAAPPGQLAACLFCGAPAAELAPWRPAEQIEEPALFLAFVADADAARASFQKFAKSSFWYPNDLRDARLELRALLVPAWAWSGTLETHWTGLVSSRTRSGKAPVAGMQRLRFDQILVPSSRTLTLRELAQLGTYDEGRLEPFHADALALPYEISELTRSAARARAMQEMTRRHNAMLRRDEGLVRIKAASVAEDLDGRTVLVPVWIGVYRYGDRPYRILVHGQTAALVGTAPKSFWKQLFVYGGIALAVLVLIAVLLVAFSTCGGAVILSQ